MNIEYEEEPYSNKPLYFLTALVLIMMVGMIMQQVQIYQMGLKLNKVQNVYIYDLEETLKGVNVDLLNREFEAKINILNNEVSLAQEKIADMKNSKVKDNFSDMYLKSLKLKRDNMIQEYTQSLQNITESINTGLVEIATQNGVAVFDKRAIATQTPAVINITPQLIEKVKQTKTNIFSN